MNLETFYGYDRLNKEHDAKLKYVLSQEGAKRWRAAAAFYLYLNPKSYGEDEQGNVFTKMDARSENAYILEENAELRKELEAAGNRFGASTDENSGRRYALRMPATMLQFIELIDPDVNSGTPAERKRSLHQLMEAFPEYRIARII